ncbi:MAG TPA: HAD-IIIC family phosphatase [Hyphomicrobium sp.]|nr:HAD-IIIC family phosphatase [Hyphomicrobium sp.]
MAIEAAPECAHRRAILPSVDWAAVASEKVAAMLGAFEQAGVPCPLWLAKAVLVAGHDITGKFELPTHLRVLQRVNRFVRDGEGGAEIDALVAALMDDDPIEADIVAAMIKRLLESSPSDVVRRLALAHAHRTHDLQRLAASHLQDSVGALPAVRLRLAGFSTTQLFGDPLALAFAAAGWRGSISQAEYGTALAELSNPTQEHDAVILVSDLAGFAPLDWRNPPDEEAQRLSERVDLLGSALMAFAERSRVPLLINTIPCTGAPGAGLLDGWHAVGIRRAIEQINRRIFEVAAASANIIAVDSDIALAELPVARHVDHKLWYYGRIAYSADATRALARAFAHAWQLLRRGPIKVLAIDFDNTLWGGVYGDDGVERLQCGHDFPGNAFRALQQECLRLRSQGILLAALSKNNADAMTVFERHPEMVLKKSDFAATAVNWDPKPQNIREVAAELNVGLDSFLFIDDSPQERDAMRRACPEVRVPEMPGDPAERPVWLRRQVATWPVRLTGEDGARQSYYAAARSATEWKASAGDHTDFLRGLEQKLVVSPLDASTVARIAQMHQRTNQFNLTTLRSTEAEIAAIAADGASGLVLHGRVSDRFGDHGIVITAVSEINGADAVLRSFLMSCRVIGREVERAFLGEVLKSLASRGVSRVFGSYIPTAKNALVRDFYQSCGFAEVESGEASGTRWVFEIFGTEFPGSPFVKIVQEQ